MSMNKEFQAKDIPDQPILDFLSTCVERFSRPGCAYIGFDNSVSQAMPEWAQQRPKLVRAKMQSLIKRGLVSGCCCGCRGDFYLKGT